MSSYLPIALLLSLLAAPLAMAADADTKQGTTSGQSTTADSGKTDGKKGKKAQTEGEAEPECD